MVPDALAASGALVHMNRVAVTGIEERMRQMGQRRAVRAAPPLMIDKGFVRKFVELSHGLPPRACLFGFVGRA